MSPDHSLDRSAIMPAPSPSPRRKVCIIGGGSSGLSLLPLALEHGLEPTLYEARTKPGGAWIVDPDPGEPRFRFDDDGKLIAIEGTSLGSFTPMYEGLRTNVPTTLMQYRGRPFASHVPLFPSPKPVTDYLAQLASEYSSQIHLAHRVTTLRWTTREDAGDQRKWFVEVSCPDGKVSAEQYDFVAIANGHYTKPYVPEIGGLALFEGKLWHSRWWRKPEVFADKTVLVVGNGASGYDITRELAQSILERRQADSTASLPRLYQSTRSPSAMGIALDDPTAPEWTKEVKAFPPIRRVEGKIIEFQDDARIEDVDVIIFATGYYFSFPFCSPSSTPFSSHPLTSSPEGGLRVRHLDNRDLFYHPDPTLALLGLPYLVLPFPLAQLQSLLISHRWSNSSPSLSIIPGTPEDAPEDRKALVYGHPKQFDLHDQWLQEVGRGHDDESFGGKTPVAIRDLRLGSKALRRAVLGF